MLLVRKRQFGRVMCLCVCGIVWYYLCVIREGMLLCVFHVVSPDFNVY